jgi:hypothetical protein
VADAQGPSSDRIVRVYGETWPRRPDAESGRAATSGGESTTVAPPRPGFRTEVEIIAFHRTHPANRPGGRSMPAGDAAIVVGGLAYGYEAGRWIFHGIREAYLSSMIKQGYTGVGQVLAIGESDARLIQRNLHASLGRRSFQIGGAVDGMVARKLRRYLRYLTTWGANFGAPGILPTPPLYHEDLGRQVNTRGWVMQRRLYSPKPRSRAQTQRPNRIPLLVPARLSSRRSGAAVASKKGAAVRRAPGASQPISPREIHDVLVRPVRNALANGRTIVDRAVEGLERRMPASRARTRVPPVAQRPEESEPAPRVTLASKPRVRSESRLTVRMQFRPPSQPRPLKLKLGRSDRSGGDATASKPSG